jgi:hypothetical protein
MYPGSRKCPMADWVLATMAMKFSGLDTDLFVGAQGLVMTDDGGGGGRR